MQIDKGLWRLITAVVSAILAFCVAGGVVFCIIAEVHEKGFHGGPASLAAAMAGLFSGGLAGLLVLILALRLLRER